MSMIEQAVLPKRISTRFCSYWFMTLFLGAMVWLVCRPTAVLAQSEPATPLMQNMEQLWHWGGFISTMTVASDTLYVGMGQSLVLLDITEPASPKFLGQLNLNAWPRDIEIVGAYALIAADSKGLFIVDVSDKQVPRLVAERHDPVIVKSIVVAAPYAYVAYQKYTATAIVNSIEILDVTHPEAPLVVNPEIAGLDDFAPNALQIANGYLFVAGSRLGLGRYSSSWGAFQAFRLTDPTAPTPLPAYHTEPGSDESFYGLKLLGDMAYVAHWDGISQFAITMPANLTVSSFLHLENLAGSTLTAIGDQLYVATQGTGVYILNASTAPTITNSTFLAQPVHAFAVQGHYAFVAREDNGIHVWDVTEPSTPREIGAYKTFVAIGGDLVAHEPFLYATGGSFSPALFSVIDLHKPAEPTLTTVITGADQGAFHPFIDDHWLLFSAKSPKSYNFDNVQFFDIAQPSAPQRVLRYQTKPFLNAAYGNHQLYIENLVRFADSSEIQVFDVAPPQEPVLAKIFSVDKLTFGDFNDIAVSPNYVYYMSFSAPQPLPFQAKAPQPYYLYVYDRGRAEIINTVELPDRFYGLYHYRDRLYGLALGNYGQCPNPIYIFDVSLPAKPTLRQSYCWGRMITDLIQDGNLLYIAAGALSVLDFTLPHAPSLAGYAVENGMSPQIAQINDTIYLLGDGLSAYRYKPPQATTRLEQGGRLLANVDPVTYTFPAAVFATPVTVTHTTHFANPWQAFSAPRFGVGRVFSLESVTAARGEAIQPTSAFSLTVTYTDAEAQAVDPATLALFRWTDGAWVLEKESAVDPATHTVIAAPTTTGLWILGRVARHRVFLPVIGR